MCWIVVLKCSLRMVLQSRSATQSNQITYSNLRSFNYFFSAIFKQKSKQYTNQEARSLGRSGLNLGTSWRARVNISHAVTPYDHTSLFVEKCHGSTADSGAYLCTYNGELYLLTYYLHDAKQYQLIYRQLWPWNLERIGIWTTGTTGNYSYIEYEFIITPTFHQLLGES